ncbi:MAG: hypothetical protein JXR48_13195 [Candidatus Delongbacteria bacterium]|nr:hypothetical protein [Candidatus Delongbacteria bacterium]MBN2835910.1 hypothetical protein [Candidatus Delongbacteria bacterium]
MKAFLWTKDLSTGLVEVDRHNSYLCSVIEEFVALKSTQENKSDFYILLTQILEYASNCFKIEELYLEHMSFPRLKAHSLEHNAFKKKMINSIEFLKDNYDSKFINDTKVFLRFWLRYHIGESDVSFKNYKQKFTFSLGL